MSITHFFITKKSENAVLNNITKTLKMEKKSGRLSKVFLSTSNMKTAIIHDKNHVYDTVELEQVDKTQYHLKSKTNNQYYCSHPLTIQNPTSDFAASREKALGWEKFNLQKTKNIMLNGDVLNTLYKISE